MVITARFAGTCPACNEGFEAGIPVEWQKGQKARHIVCGDAEAPEVSSGVDRDVLNYVREGLGETGCSRRRSSRSCAYGCGKLTSGDTVCGSCQSADAFNPHI